MRRILAVALASTFALTLVQADESSVPPAAQPVSEKAPAKSTDSANTAEPVNPPAPATAPHRRAGDSGTLATASHCPGGGPVPAAVTPVPANGSITDRRVLGVAPDMANSAPGLRREGDFILSRRGRVILEPGNKGPMFVFSADGANAVEPPLRLAPAQLTEQVERIIAQRGDRVVFIITGQVLTYRGANYLLPTQIMEDFDKGNLNP
ncbi:MAG: hypothetical protein HC898_01470 [Phycisphaerales bacterium]|nr:hypothetical protein [Phycisphaerales bacterium]